MTTPLSRSPVTRSLDKKIDDREVIVTMEVVDGKHLLHFRLKGFKTGWFLSLDNLSEIASWHPRLKDRDMELMMVPKDKLKESLETFDWKSKYGKDLI